VGLLLEAWPEGTQVGSVFGWFGYRCPGPWRMAGSLAEGGAAASQSWPQGCCLASQPQPGRVAAEVGAQPCAKLLLAARRMCSMAAGVVAVTGRTGAPVQDG